MPAGLPALVPLTTPEQPTPTSFLGPSDALGNAGLCGTALDRTLLPTRDGSGSL